VANADAKAVSPGGEGLPAKIAGWPARVKEYFLDLQGEMKRVTWPAWKQVRATTLVVIAAVFAFAAYFFLVDLLLGRAITRIFNMFTR
jgi:preprotein translocase subunit SecE